MQDELILLYPTSLSARPLAHSWPDRPAKFQVLWREFELTKGRARPWAVGSGRAGRQEGGRDNSSNLPPYNYFLHAAAAAAATISFLVTSEIRLQLVFS